MRVKQIGKYVVKELLAQGGMGEIYKGSHPTLERDVAIKLIRTNKANDPNVVDRFQREAKVVAALRHPGIVQVHDFDIEEDAFYMVMEFVRGESLADRLTNLQAQGKLLPLAETLRIFRSITHAVAYAHEQGVIHCDLKPSNVLLTREEQPILVDFGISKIMSDERLTATNDILGTPHYMSPEQGFGREITPQADIYALGVMLYELSTGKLPFNGTSPMSIVFKHINEQPKTPRSLNPYLPEYLDQIIQKAMAKNPAKRYSSAREFLTDIEAVIASVPPAHEIPNPPVEQSSLFICYKHDLDPDQKLASYLYESLIGQGHRVFLDKEAIRTGETWLEEIDQQIKESDFLIVLLSKTSADSEMVKSELSRAYEYRKLHDKPNILPIRIAYEGLLPYTIAAFLEPLQYIIWQSEADNTTILKEILDAIAGQYPEHERPMWVRPAAQTSVLAEDGQLISLDEPSSPLPAFDPRFLKELVVPGGAAKLRDRLYIERTVDAQLKDQVVKWGTTTTIRAPRQTGKTSLLMRGIQYAREQGAHVVFMDFQSFGTNQLASLDLFLWELAATICDELELDEDIAEEAWQGSRSPTKKLLRFMEKNILSEFEQPVVLAMDEADSLLQTDFYKDFFGLLRSWHNRRASRMVWEKLNMILVISTEPYLLIDDIHQSPFNVGLHLGLTDFEEKEVRILNLRHGSPINEDDIPHLMALLNGQPFLTRLAMYKMVTEGIPWGDLNSRAANDYGPFGDHLRHQYWTIHDKPDLKNALRDVIRTNRCANETALFRLLQAGLITGSGDQYTCRCDLYKLYFEDKLL